MTKNLLDKVALVTGGFTRHWSGDGKGSRGRRR
jgi:hypothetical protein